jgi:hypothetical protein
LEPAALVGVYGLAFFVSKKINLKWMRCLVVACAFLFFFLSVQEAEVWSNSISVRKKALIDRPTSLSLKGDYLRELLTELSHHNDPLGELKKSRDSMISDLTSKCGEASNDLRSAESPYINCHTFFQTAYSIYTWNNRPEQAEVYLHQYLLSMSLLKPVPKMAERVQFESSLRLGKVTPSDSQHWLESNEFFPDSSYRSLRLITECISNPDLDSKSQFETYLEENLLTTALFKNYLENNLHPSLRAQILKCLTV